MADSLEFKFILIDDTPPPSLAALPVTTPAGPAAPPPGSPAAPPPPSTYQAPPPGFVGPQIDPYRLEARQVGAVDEAGYARYRQAEDKLVEEHRAALAKSNRDQEKSIIEAEVERQRIKQAGPFVGPEIDPALLAARKEVADQEADREEARQRAAQREAVGRQKAALTGEQYLPEDLTYEDALTQAQKKTMPPSFVGPQLPPEVEATRAVAGRRAEISRIEEEKALRSARAEAAVQNELEAMGAAETPEVIATPEAKEQIRQEKQAQREAEAEAKRVQKEAEAEAAKRAKENAPGNSTKAIGGIFDKLGMNDVGNLLSKVGDFQAQGGMEGLSNAFGNLFGGGESAAVEAAQAANLGTSATEAAQAAPVAPTAVGTAQAVGPTTAARTAATSAGTSSASTVGAEAAAAGAGAAGAAGAAGTAAGAGSAAAGSAGAAAGGAAGASGAAAGVAGAAGSAALAAAGPIGAAIALADAAGGMIAGKINDFSQSVREGGDVIKSLAGNDNLGAVTKSANMVAESLGKIPIVGQVMEAEIKAATAVIETFRAVVDSFVERGKQLAQYSGPLSEANAMAEVRDIMADMREAEELGPGIARLTDAQSTLSVEFREMLLPVKQFIVEKLAGFLEFLVDLISGIRDGIAAVQASSRETVAILGDFFDAITPGGNFSLLDLPKLVKDAPDRIGKAVAEAVKEGKDKKEIGDILDKQMRMLLDQLPAPGIRGGVDPLRDLADQQVNAPLFGFE